jgi:hypothetical protein
MTESDSNRTTNTTLVNVRKIAADGLLQPAGV